MQKIDTQLVYSPSDLVRYLESPYASWMDRFALEHPELAPDTDEADAMMALLAERGIAHENAQEQEFRDQGLAVINIETQKGLEFIGNSSGQSEQPIPSSDMTYMMIDTGVDVIAQATLTHGEFRGYADFLIKRPGASELGDWHYEVWDTKLSKTVRPGYVIQLCCYADMLSVIQGGIAWHCVVALGNQHKEHIRLADCMDYYFAVKQEFLTSQSSWSADSPPGIFDSSNYGRWSDHVQGLLIDSDHVSQVANITRAMMDKLEVAGITTQEALAAIGDQTVVGIDSTRLKRLSMQAKLQIESKGREHPVYRVIPAVLDIDNVDENDPQAATKTAYHSLESLPRHSSNDVFFDIEGFPLDEGGLEYLWGVTYFDSSGERCFRDWWAHDRSQEREAFEQFVDWAYARWQEDTTMHIYHYAPYEITACKRLMGRFGTRESELDELLRKNVFIDLYSIVRNSLVIGEPRYSIKNVEKLYRDKRDTDVGTGGDSVVVYDAWRQARSALSIAARDAGTPEDILAMQGDTWQSSSILEGIRDYNKDDCDSTQELTEWLRLRQVENDITPILPRSFEAEIPGEEQTELVTLRDDLLYQAKVLEQSENTERQQTAGLLARNLAGFLEFHRREDKPSWWRLFDRMACTPQELLDDPSTLACCTRTEREPFLPTPKGKMKAYEYRFDKNQAYKGIGKSPYIHGEVNNKGYPVKVTPVEPDQTIPDGMIVIKSWDELGAEITFLANEIVPNNNVRKAVASVIASINPQQLAPCAINDFLTRAKPRIKDYSGGPIATGSTPEEKLASTVSAVLNLDNSYLTIQGPPGTGKSYTGARIITALLVQGKRVGISSNSHNAINNLLVKAAEHCHETGVEGRFICNRMTDEIPANLGIVERENKDLSAECVSGVVMGTTVWGFSREDLVGQLDVLIVDEAGQVATANLIAMSRAASNIVLLGDQMQLGQPTQGSHPADSGLSVLDYLLRDTPTIPDDQGVFLETCYRMHPAINEFISSRIYEGKLKADKSTAARTIVAKAGTGPLIDLAAGITFVPIIHSGNTQDSVEEVEEIKRLADQLIGMVRTDSYGNEHTIDIADMLFVAPYNMQVRRLEESLGSDARVGSVDKFQGQEAPIVFISLCTSDAAASPRGIDFLFDRNRLNVAVSRAQTLVVVVGHPDLATTRVGSLEQLKKVNLLAALLAEGAARELKS